MSKTSSSSSGGVGVVGLLGVVFVTLKLTGYITWSWWYVTMPFWGGVAIIFGIFVFIACFWAIKAVIDYWRYDRIRKA